MEKQKTGRAEAMVREQRGAMEKELNVIQAKAQGSYQEAQGMQMKVRMGPVLSAIQTLTTSFAQIDSSSQFFPPN